MQFLGHGSVQRAENSSRRLENASDGLMMDILGISWDIYLFPRLESDVWSRWTLRFALPLQKLETLKRESILLGFYHNSRRRRNLPFTWTSYTRMSLCNQGPASLGRMLVAAGHWGLAYLETESMGFMLLKGAWRPLHHHQHSVTWWLKFQNGWKIPCG